MHSSSNCPKGSRYLTIRDLDPHNHNNLVYKPYIRNNMLSGPSGLSPEQCTEPSLRAQIDGIYPKTIVTIPTTTTPRHSYSLSLYIYIYTHVHIYVCAYALSLYINIYTCTSMYASISIVYTFIDLFWHFGPFRACILVRTSLLGG